MLPRAEFALLATLVDDDRVQMENTAVLHVRLRDCDTAASRVRLPQHGAASRAAHAHHGSLVDVKCRLCALLLAFQKTWLVLLLLLTARPD